MSGGSEAIEAALKMARQYFVETGEPQRRHFIARRQSYHGNTLGALAAGGNEWRRAPFAPLLIETHHIAPCFAYRFQRAGRERRGLWPRAPPMSWRTKILELGAGHGDGLRRRDRGRRHAGAVPPVAGYFKRIREICDRHGVLLILDEVMCGMGRTGTLHACEQEGIAPDLMTIAKGLGGGYQPIGAVLLGEHIYDAFADGSGFFQHGHTYIGHPLACAAALAVQQVDPSATTCSPTCARRARCCSGGWASASATTRMSATSAAAACSGRSSWSRTARPRRRSIRRASSMRGSRRRRWRAA